jgi:hypothetical protein
MLKDVLISAISVMYECECNGEWLPLYTFEDDPQIATQIGARSGLWVRRA